MRAEDIIAWTAVILAVIGIIFFWTKALNKLFDKIEKIGRKEKNERTK